MSLFLDTSAVKRECGARQKAQGSAFATNGIINREHFTLLSGENNLTAYETTPVHKKYFCKICGSPIYSDNMKSPDQLRIRIGAIESDITESPMAHIFVTSKANWDEITDDLPRYESYEPNR